MMLKEVVGIISMMIGVVIPGDAMPECRCTPAHPCWAEVPWRVLNTSVKGRLQLSADELAPCLASSGGDPASAACALTLNSTDNEFWVSGQPNGYLHTGLFNSWNISTDRSVYTVVAESEEDISATVRFAHTHNLRLVVKGTGHDWYGRSTAAGSLLLWTHPRKAITWHDDGYVAAGCPESTATPAVTVQTGVQFADLYPVAIARNKIVMGGTCDSVGVGGCFSAGCYGPFTKLFGNAAVNILEARVVLANGTIVTASKCSHPDLFWSVRGGGGGVAGVFTEFTVRSHRSPSYMSAASFTGTAKTERDYIRLLAQTLKMLAVVQANASRVCNDGSLAWSWAGEELGGGTAGIHCTLYEGDPSEMRAVLQPLADWAKGQNGSTIEGNVAASISWNASDYDPTSGRLPWMEKHPDREISTALLASMSKYFPVHYIATDPGASVVAAALVNISDLLPQGQQGTNAFMIAKGQSGVPSSVASELLETAQNPVLLDAAGTQLIMYNIPSLPQMPPSSALLKTLWPRLQQYAIRDPKDPLWHVCEAGANGIESSAVECMNVWYTRIPALQERLAQVRDVLWEVFPNIDAGGRPFSGSYWCETDYNDRDFQLSHWGEAVYQRLLSVKARYDPNGLFICHHCVGSELWSKESNLNCRAPTSSHHRETEFRS
eukprot:m.447216 g.447216  ORF g.447216 m.447216 type:complete len:663 (-) comp19484_c0_seq1:10-1998(-)